MLAFIREWVITIISVIIFVTFIEILIPNSNYKRYINVITGLLLIVVILTPLTKFINRQIDFEEEVLKIFNQLELSTAQNKVDNIQYSNDEAVMALYKNKISEQIKSYIENNTEYIVSEVFVYRGFLFFHNMSLLYIINIYMANQLCLFYKKIKSKDFILGFYNM
jgi:stage III sporulation protein AF